MNYTVIKSDMMSAEKPKLGKVERSWNHAMESSSGKKKVLITALGTSAASTIVRELREDQSLYLIGADIVQSNQIVTSQEIDEFYVFPPSVTEQEKYIEFVLDFCQKHNVDYYFAIIDEEVVSVLANRDRFEALGVKLCMVNDEVIQKCHYKNIFSSWIESEFPEIAIKEYRTDQDIKNAQYPLFIKPVEGRASIGCQTVKSYELLQEILNNKLIGQDIIVQENIEYKKIVTVDVLRNKRTGQFFQLQRIELLRNSKGCGIAVKIIYDKALAKIVTAICEKLDLDGIINIEFFVCAEGYKIIEINPRFSAGYVFTYMSGAKFAMNAIKIAEGMACDIPQVEIGKFYAKRYEAYEMQVL